MHHQEDQPEKLLEAVPGVAVKKGGVGKEVLQKDKLEGGGGQQAKDRHRRPVRKAMERSQRLPRTPYLAKGTQARGA